MSDKEEKNLSSPFGNLSITQAGAYGKISSNGRVDAQVPFSAQKIAINGRLEAQSDVNVKEGTINGNATIKGNLTIDTITINGRTDVQGRLVVEEHVQLNGGVFVTVGVLGTPKGKLSINGNIETPEVMQLDNFSLNGRAKIKKIEQVNSLHISGSAYTENIEIAKDIVFRLIGKSEIGKIKAQNVTIGQDIKDVNNRFELFGKEFILDIKKHDGFAEIDEIYATGIVELDHVKVNKVYAKELYIDDETEIGEFIELVTEQTSTPNLKIDPPK